ncbi:zinc-binding dehydrogenase [Kitasatospora sp. RB6PN24]|uniref:zinc-binding dehydrogenase n=1 Tax=Kitasatospora humi TaxID=2893891 RepID=UPI001E5A85B3|nr:zinc-binding dehydrogenase [Kitasatospora humi]MCC9311024.1 zinc-binding dehydrogenase [Kitasatospora humi]
MRAIWLEQFGDPSVLVPGAAPDPVPEAGEVLVAVEFAGITFVETQFRATGAGPFKGELPMVPGNGVAGTVTAVGAGTDPALLGRRVVSSTGGSGGYAERVAVPATGVFEVPDGLALDEAMALLADGRTAVLQLRAVRPAAGERVLVEAAAGGVGSLLVQLAKAAGAEVVAAAGGPRKLALARELGADEVVDYREADWTGQVAPVDAVFDGVGGAIGRAAFELLGAGGRMVSYGLASGEWAAIPARTAAARGVALVTGERTPAALRDATEYALAEAAAGRLRPVIGQRFPLAEAAAAHAAIESRATVGKTLLEVGAPPRAER